MKVNNPNQLYKQKQYKEEISKRIELSTYYREKCLESVGISSSILNIIKNSTYGK